LLALTKTVAVLANQLLSRRRTRRQRSAVADLTQTPDRFTSWVRLMRCPLAITGHSVGLGQFSSGWASRSTWRHMPRR